VAYLASADRAGAFCFQTHAHGGGRKAATLRHPSWVGRQLGLAPFPTYLRQAQATMMASIHRAAAAGEGYQTAEEDVSDPPGLTRASSASRRGSSMVTTGQCGCASPVLRAASANALAAAGLPRAYSARAR
jgi:hypothetical protein